MSLPLALLFFPFQYWRTDPQLLRSDSAFRNLVRIAKVNASCYTSAFDFLCPCNCESVQELDAKRAAAARRAVQQVSSFYPLSQAQLIGLLEHNAFQNSIFPTPLYPLSFYPARTQALPSTTILAKLPHTYRVFTDLSYRGLGATFYGKILNVVNCVHQLLPKLQERYLHDLLTFKRCICVCDCLDTWTKL